ncbi:MAG: biotin/lipoyl-containing protein [Terracidiphilus sp.]
MKLQITVNGRAYAVEVEVMEDDEDEQTQGYPANRAAGPTGVGAHGQGFGAAWDAEGQVCHSPVMGLVIKVNVNPGQTVEAGEVLIVLEAMKMETNIAALHAGKVKCLHVSAGDSVKQDQVLAELE